MSARSLNRVMLIGNLTRDPELRYTPQGTAVCSFGLATNRGWTDQAGQKQEEVEFHNIVAWQKLAELCSQLLFKGRKVYVDGRMQTRKWTGSDNQERQTTEVVIDNMIILDSRRREEGEEQARAVPVSRPAVPAAAPAPAAGQAASSDDNAQSADETADKTAKKTAVKKDKANKEETKNEQEPASEEVGADDIPF